jgi:hypothetical protein
MKAPESASIHRSARAARAPSVCRDIIGSSMASRRTFLKAALGVSATGAVMRPSSAQTVVAPYYKAIFDERFVASNAFAAGAVERGIPTAAVRGDVTKLFFDDLDLRWKQAPVLLAGYTTARSLFCLDLLARDQGMRISHCDTEPGVEAALEVLDGGRPLRRPSHLPSGDSLLFWIIAPSRSNQTRVCCANSPSR